MEWKRRDLKERAKESVKRNYWWFVLASFILLVAGGGGSSFNFNFNQGQNQENTYDSVSQYGSNLDVMKEQLFSNPMLKLIIGVSLVVVLAIVVAAILFSVFVAGPVVVGMYRFIIHAKEGRRDLNDIIYAFTCGHYLNIVKIMFFKSLKTFLWMLLLVVPGVVKSYEYRMIPYILSENPEMDMERVFSLTKEMTDGDKWNMWVLDLSFIGWAFLAAITFNIVGIFWVYPYMYATFAELYLVLREKTFNNGLVSGGELTEYARMAYTESNL